MLQASLKHFEWRINNEGRYLRQRFNKRLIYDSNAKLRNVENMPRCYQPLTRHHFLILMLMRNRGVSKIMIKELQTLNILSAFVCLGDDCYLVFYKDREGVEACQDVNSNFKRGEC